MTRLLILLLAALPMWATNYGAFASGSVLTGGNWKACVGGTGTNCNGGTFTGSSAVPGLGDTAYIGPGFAMTLAGTWNFGTCPTSFTVGTTAPDLEIQGSTSGGGLAGSLTVTSGSLEVCGMVDMAGTNRAYVGYATLQISSGATLSPDQGNNSLNYFIYSDNYYEANRVFIGTLGDGCGLTTGSCTSQFTCIRCGSAKPFIVNSAYLGDFDIKIYGTGITNCGTSSGCVVANATLTATANNTFDLENNVWNTTGALQGAFNTGLTLNLTRNRFINTTAAAILGTAGTAPGNCTLSTNYFDVTVGNISLGFACAAVNNNVFAGSLFSAPLAIGLGTWNNNWFRRNDGCQNDGNKLAWYANTNTNIYLTCDTGNASSLHISGFSGSTANVSAASINGFVCQIIDGTLLGESHCILEAATGTLVLTMSNAISTNGANSTLTAGQMQTPNPGTTGQTEPPHAYSHMTVVGNPVESWLASIGHTGFWPTNQQITSLVNSVFQGNGFPDANAQPITMPYTGNTTIPAGLIASGSVDYNVTYDGTVGATFGSGYNSNCSPSLTQGTNYNYCEASVTPGPHDLVGVSPAFVNTNRGITTWAASEGQAATVAGALAVFSGAQFSAYPGLFNELFEHVKIGYAPTNHVVLNRDSDATTPGAVQPVMYMSSSGMRVVNK